MDTKRRNKKAVFLAVWLAVIAVIIVGIILLWPPGAKHETIKELMRDSVLHEHNKMALFGLKVNPGLISAYVVTAVLLLAAALIRIFAIPKFETAPGKFQSVIEKMVEFFSDMAHSNSHHKPRFIGAYIFSAGVYIFFGTLFELLGVQWITTSGMSMSLPAPVSDINAAIALGVMSYVVILGAGILCGGFRGAMGVLKDFSLPISMSFRLFGALISGLLVTELVYYYVSLSFVLPVVVGVLFTLLHAVVQAYVLTTLVSIFYGEASEPPKPREKKVRQPKVRVPRQRRPLKARVAAFTGSVSYPLFGLLLGSLLVTAFVLELAFQCFGVSVQLLAVTAILLAVLCALIRACLPAKLEAVFGEEGTQNNKNKNVKG